MMFLTLIWLFIVGLFGGTIGSLLGLGGGIIIIPALLLFSEHIPQFAGIQPAEAIGTSLILVILTALSSTMSYAKKKRIDYHSGWYYFISCGPAAMIGAYIARFFDPDSFFIAFGILMVAVSILLFVKNRLPRSTIPHDVQRVLTDDTGQTYRFGYHRGTALSLSFVIGLTSGLFGIGGGALLVPLMIILFRYPTHIATATSMFTILLTSISGSLIHFVQGNINWHAVLFLAPGVWLGGKFGVWISNRLTSKGLLNVLRFAFLIIAVRMVAKGLHLI